MRRADVLLGKGTKVPEVCKKVEITEQTYYRWRQKYSGMQPEIAKQLKALQKENSRLKKMVVEQALDMAILKEAPNVSRMMNDSVFMRCVFWPSNAHGLGRTGFTSYLSSVIGKTTYKSQENNIGSV